MIHPDKYYTISDLMSLSKDGYFPVKNRGSILKLIHEGKLLAIDVGTKEKPAFHIKGEMVQAFLDERGRFEIPTN